MGPKTYWKFSRFDEFFHLYFNMELLEDFKNYYFGFFRFTLWNRHQKYCQKTKIYQIFQKNKEQVAHALQWNRAWRWINIIQIGIFCRNLLNIFFKKYKSQPFKFRSSTFSQSQCRTRLRVRHCNREKLEVLGFSPLFVNSPKNHYK